MKWYYIVLIIAGTALLTNYLTKQAIKMQCPEGKKWDSASKSCK